MQEWSLKRFNMDLRDLEKFLKQGEDSKIEFKSAFNSVPDSFYETVVSFSNTDGGTIFLGVNNDGIVEGINPDSIAKLQKDIITALNTFECINPPVFVQPITIIHPDGMVMVIQIPSSSQVHKYTDRIYSREFESDIDVTDNQEKVSEIFLRKRTFFTESQIYPELKISDLDPDLFQKARDIIRGNRSDHPWLLVDDNQMLKESVLWRKDFKTGEEGLTLAAALIFGKDTTIQSLLPAYKVDAMVRIENKDRWDDRIDPPLRTNLIDTYLMLKDFIFRHLPQKFHMEGDQRIDLRDKIFREIIGNIIVHREYTSALSSELIIHKNAVITTNPNKASFHGPIDLNSFNPYPKNPNIRKFFTSFGWTDEIGSGIRNTTKYLPLYVKGAIPSFIEDDVFKTEIPLNTLTFSQYSKDVLNWLEIGKEVLPHLEKGLATILLDADLSGNKWKEVLLYLVPSWHQKGTNLKTLDWPEKQIFSKEDIEKVSSWYEKSTKILHKKARYIITILFLCSESISLESLMNALDYKNRKTFRENYLNPLEQVQFIEKTNPEKPNDPEQKYRTTEKGKLFINGK